MQKYANRASATCKFGASPRRSHNSASRGPIPLNLTPIRDLQVHGSIEKISLSSLFWKSNSFFRRELPRPFSVGSTLTRVGRAEARLFEGFKHLTVPCRGTGFLRSPSDVWVFRLIYLYFFFRRNICAFAYSVVVVVWWNLIFFADKFLVFVSGVLDLLDYWVWAAAGSFMCVFYLFIWYNKIYIIKLTIRRLKY